MMMQNVVDAAHGYVSSNLLSIQDLKYAINVAREKYALTPIFTTEEIIHYYPLLNSFLTTDSIVINILFRSSHRYQLFEIEPFPMMLNNSMYMLDGSKTLVLTNDEHSSYAKMSNEDLKDKCHTNSIGIYYSPSSMFSLIPVRETGVCEMQLLMTNSTRSLDICPYKQIVKGSFHHTLFMNKHYFIFPEFVEVTIRCPEGHTYKRVKGIIQVRRECALTSLVVANIKEHTHQENLPPHSNHLQELSLNISHINYIINKLHHLYLRNISSFSGAVKLNLPSYLKTQFHFPLIMSPIAITIVIVFIILYLNIMVRRIKRMSIWSKGKKRTVDLNIINSWSELDLQQDSWAPEPTNSTVM